MTAVLPTYIRSSHVTSSDFRILPFRQETPLAPEIPLCLQTMTYLALCGEVVASTVAHIAPYRIAGGALYTSISTTRAQAVRGEESISREYGMDKAAAALPVVLCRTKTKSAGLFPDSCTRESTPRLLKVSRLCEHPSPSTAPWREQRRFTPGLCTSAERNRRWRASLPLQASWKAVRCVTRAAQQVFMTFVAGPLAEVMS